MWTNVFLLENFLFWKLSKYGPRPTRKGQDFIRGGAGPLAPRWLRSWLNLLSEKWTLAWLMNYKNQRKCWSRTRQARGGAETETAEKRRRRAEAETNRGRDEQRLRRTEAEARKSGRVPCNDLRNVPAGNRWRSALLYRKRAITTKCAWWLSPRARSERRTSSASNAAHWSGSHARLHMNAPRNRDRLHKQKL